MTHLERAILCGVHRSGRWRLLLFRFRSLGNHPKHYFAVSNALLHKRIRGRREKGHAPFELASLLVRLIRDGALEDRAEEHQPPCAVVELLIAHARFLQDMVHDLYAVGTH